MILEIVKYGNPVLRQKGARIEAITPEIKKLISDMLETMEKAHGVGLAAQQISQARQLAVIDVSEIEDRPSTMEIKGEQVDPKKQMPLVLINPEIKPNGKDVTGGEGCLSFPEIFGEITRPEFVDVIAQNEKGERIEFRAGGLLSRAVQHEVDHLNGILFIDRMNRVDKEDLKPELEELQKKTKAGLKSRS
jgi:peptide deformylase